MHSGFARQIGAVVRYAATKSSRVMPSRTLNVTISVIIGASVGCRRSGARTPRRRRQQLDLLRHEERAELAREAFDEVLVRVHGGPVRAPVGVVVELPQVNEL